MKFKCGKTAEEQEAEEIAKGAELEYWCTKGNKEFVWIPTRVARGDCRWLETVLSYPAYRESYFRTLAQGYSWSWIYYRYCDGVYVSREYRALDNPYPT